MAPMSSYRAPCDAGDVGLNILFQISFAKVFMDRFGSDLEIVINDLAMRLGLLMDRR